MRSSAAAVCLGLLVFTGCDDTRCRPPMHAEEIVQASRSLSAGHELGPGDYETARICVHNPAEMPYSPGSIGAMHGRKLVQPVGQGQALSPSDFGEGLAEITF